jgi:hypothetical protein
MPTKEDLEAQVHELQEKLYTIDPKSRPTIMKTIEDKEASLLSMIKWQIEQLEKETGRKFPYTFISKWALMTPTAYIIGPDCSNGSEE